MLGDLLVAHIRQLFEWVLPACLRFVRKNVKEIQPSLDTNLAQACMRLFYSLLDEFRPSGSEEAPVPPKGKPAYTHSHVSTCNSTWAHASLPLSVCTWMCLASSAKAECICRLYLTSSVAAMLVHNNMHVLVCSAWI